MTDKTKPPPVPDLLPRRRRRLRDANGDEWWCECCGPSGPAVDVAADPDGICLRCPRCRVGVCRAVGRGQVTAIKADALRWVLGEGGLILEECHPRPFGELRDRIRARLAELEGHTPPSPERPEVTRAVEDAKKLLAELEGRDHGA